MTSGGSARTGKVTAPGQASRRVGTGGFSTNINPVATKKPETNGRRRIPRDSVTPRYVDAVPSSILPTLAIRAPGAQRIRSRDTVDRGADLGATAGFPGHQSGRHYAGPGRRGPAADPRRRHHRGTSRRALR